MSEEYKEGEPYIATVGGGQFWFLEPEKNAYDIDIIAHALSKLCRFGGHSNWFYSVAEHSILMAEWTERFMGSKHKALQALLHDAGEAYLVDVPRPIKLKCPDYKAIENTVEAALRKQFELPHPLPNWLQELDMRMLKTERDVMVQGNFPWVCDELQPLEQVTFKFWQPEEAKLKFKDAYARLG